MSDAAEPERKERPQKSALDELRERLSELLGALLHPPVLVPVPVRRRR